jgi:hypothetical protein
MNLNLGTYINYDKTNIASSGPNMILDQIFRYKFLVFYQGMREIDKSYIRCHGPVHKQ